MSTHRRLTAHVPLQLTRETEGDRDRERERERESETKGALWREERKERFRPWQWYFQVKRLLCATVDVGTYNAI